MTEDDLVKNIKDYCIDEYGVYEAHTRAFVTTYCILNDIHVDTVAWDELITDLWCDNDIGVYIRGSFNTLDDFDLYIGGDLS